MDELWVGVFRGCTWAIARVEVHFNTFSGRAQKGNEWGAEPKGTIPGASENQSKIENCLVSTNKCFRLWDESMAVLKNEHNLENWIKKASMVLLFVLFVRNLLQLIKSINQSWAYLINYVNVSDSSSCF